MLQIKKQKDIVKKMTYKKTGVAGFFIRYIKNNFTTAVSAEQSEDG